LFEQTTLQNKQNEILIPESQNNQISIQKDRIPSLNSNSIQEKNELSHQNQNQIVPHHIPGIEINQKPDILIIPQSNMSVPFNSRSEFNIHFSNSESSENMLKDSKTIAIIFVEPRDTEKIDQILKEFPHLLIVIVSSNPNLHTQYQITKTIDESLDFITQQVTQVSKTKSNENSNFDNSKKNNEIIHFYNFGEPYYEFTNFQFGYPISLDNKEWKTTEHYFQAQKFQDKKLQKEVQHTNSPRDAFNFARSNENYKRKDWELVKDDIMHKAVLAKFTQHLKLKNLLLNTGDSILVEHTTNDRYWGDGGDSSGLNKLGQTLMKVRQELRNADKKI